MADLSHILHVARTAKNIERGQGGRITSKELDIPFFLMGISTFVHPSSRDPGMSEGDVSSREGPVGQDRPAGVVNYHLRAPVDVHHALHLLLGLLGGLRLVVCLGVDEES